MAQYKVPQDVEADDKLIGPFSFRQFVYLLVVGGCIALAIGLWQIFPLLAIIPLPPILLFAALALPIKKDQPMETYLAAIVSYYLKPRNRIWTPGQRESTIQITAPKIVEEERARDITGEEATHRLSFLADIVDTEGYAIKGVGNHVNEELAVEANTTNDMFESNHFDSLENTIAKDENDRHAEVIRTMKENIEKAENLSDKQTENATIEKRFEEEKPDFSASVVVQPNIVENDKNEVNEKTEDVKKVDNNLVNPSIIELANNDEYSVATIAKEANRIKEKEEGEVFISLH